MPFDEIGYQIAGQLSKEYTITDLIGVARLASENGFKRVWINDNLRYHHAFVSLAAIASHVPIGVGTAILVPYFRNPVDLADGVASIAEFCQGEFSVGIARGDMAQLGNIISSPKPITMIEETAKCLRALLAGDVISWDDYPFLSSYFRLKSGGKVQLAFRPKRPVRLYCGATAPKSADVAGRVMDGIVLAGYSSCLLELGRLDSILEIAKDAANKTGRQLQNIFEINVALSRDDGKALEFIRPYAAHVMIALDWLGLTSKEFIELGVQPREVEKLKQAFAKGSTIEEASSLVTDEMCDAVFVARGPKPNIERILNVCDKLEKLGISRIVFAKLGPSLEESIQVISREVMPLLH